MSAQTPDPQAARLEETARKLEELQCSPAARQLREYVDGVNAIETALERLRSSITRLQRDMQEPEGGAV